MFGKHNVLIGLLITSPTIAAFSSPFQAAQQGNRIPWWVWVLIILVLIVLLIWWWQRRSEEETAPAAKAEAVAPAPVVKAPVPAAEPTTPDNLKRIEGIGPKISSVLNQAGITTFAQLAETNVNQLKQLLTDAGLSALADPTTWPEQAHLAAAGEWGALETLQDELKGGRRT